MGGTPHLDRPGRAANLRIWCVICAGQTRNFQRLAVLSGVISPLRNGVDALCRPIRAEFRAYGRRRQQAFVLVTASQGQMWSHFGVDPETQSGLFLAGTDAGVVRQPARFANHLFVIQVRVHRLGVSIIGPWTSVHVASGMTARTTCAGARSA